MNETLWTPWRRAYVSSAGEPPTDDLSLFERLAAADDEFAGIVHRGQTAFVVLNAFPYSSGHLLVAPYRKTADLNSLADEEVLELAHLVTAAVGWLQIGYAPDGFNVGLNLGHAAGAGVPDHLHYHVVPRWRGDTNFMTSVAHTRIVPDDLAGAFALLGPIARAHPPKVGNC